MKQILVIDDQPCVRELIAEELLQEGYRVNGVDNAAEVGEYLKTTRPDLVLLDLYLKGFEGWDVLRAIKGQDPDLPVLIFTAYDSYSKDPRSSQADGYLIKSLNVFDALKEKIAMLLNN